MKAFDPLNSYGRRYNENYSVYIQNPFLEDLVRIFHSKSYRRLADKTQVITVPRNTYTRTRATHTAEVMAVSITISENLLLNTSLCQAIAAGHDIGHMPYGHLGEKVISDILGKPFYHNICGVVVAEHIEKLDGRGLNLSFETLEGILHHSRTGLVKLNCTTGVPQEYNVVMFADKIAYTFSDVNDAIRYGYIDGKALPKFIMDLGDVQDKRTYNVLGALIEESRRKGRVEFSEGDVFQNFEKTRRFMFDEVYLKMNHDIKEVVLRKAYDFFSKEAFFEGANPAVILAMLTDKEANKLGEIMSEAGRITVEDIRGLGILDSVERLRGKTIDLTDPDLDWGKKDN
jgi:dGTPase